MIATLEQAIAAKALWRSEVMDRYVTGFLLAGIELARKRVPFVNNDDVADRFQAHDRTTSGAAIAQMVRAGLIIPYYGNHPEQGIEFGTRKSTRPENHKHRNRVYSLASVRIAETWLERHGVDLPRAAVQTEFFEQAQQVEGGR